MGSLLSMLDFHNSGSKGLDQSRCKLHAEPEFARLSQASCCRWEHYFFSRNLLPYRAQATLRDACVWVVDSGALKSVMETVLAIGNIMNRGTFKGGAAGFSLDSLLKLTQTRSTSDKKVTLMEYLCNVLENKGDAEVLSFSDAASSLHAASSIAPHALQSESLKLTNGLKKLIQARESPSVSGDSGDKYMQGLSDVIGRVSDDVSSLDDLVKDTLEKCSAMCQYFGEGSSVSFCAPLHPYLRVEYRRR